MVLEMTYSQLERAVNPTHDIKLFAGRSNPALAQEIADYLVKGLFGEVEFTGHSLLTKVKDWEF